MSDENTRALNQYLEVMANTGNYPRKGNLRFLLTQVFGDFDFRDKRILDVGGGSGLFTFYAASQGAREAICLEPELDGCTKDASSQFDSIRKQCGYDCARLLPLSFQAYSNTCASKFDLILLFASINHLDETACIRLLQDDAARSAYSRIFQMIAGLTVAGGKVIICDCSNRNFFADIGLRNPFAPSIEWHKHQSPEVWARLLTHVGYSKPTIAWTSHNTLRRPGNAILGNRLAAYFLMSDFVLTMTKD